MRKIRSIHLYNQATGYSSIFRKTEINDLIDLLLYDIKGINDYKEIESKLNDCGTLEEIYNYVETLKEKDPWTYKWVKRLSFTKQELIEQLAELELNKDDLKQILINNFTNEEYENQIDLSNIDFEGYDVSLSGLKADNICNGHQVAKHSINNREQTGKDIFNSLQKAKNTIANDIQKADVIYNGNQAAKSVIHNIDQKSKKIENTDQTAKEINNDYQKEN